jgi:hypothetical protein
MGNKPNTDSVLPVLIDLFEPRGKACNANSSLSEASASVPLKSGCAAFD